MFALRHNIEAFSHHVLQEVCVEQVQMDELFALLSAVKDDEVTEAQAVKRLSRSPNWVWVAMDPVCKLILTVDVGERTLAMAQHLVHQVTQVLAPDCAPLFLTDGFREYLTALVTHYGHWIQPERRQAKGPPLNEAAKSHWRHAERIQQELSDRLGEDPILYPHERSTRPLGRDTSWFVSWRASAVPR